MLSFFLNIGIRPCQTNIIEFLKRFKYFSRLKIYTEAYKFCKFTFIKVFLKVEIFSLNVEPLLLYSTGEVEHPYFQSNYLGSIRHHMFCVLRGFSLSLSLSPSLSLFSALRLSAQPFPPSHYIPWP